jgi:hypothetical protein
MTDALSDAYSAPDPVVAETTINLCQAQIRRESRGCYWQCTSCNLETMGRWDSPEGAIEGDLNGFRLHAVEVAAGVHARLARAGLSAQPRT